LVFHFHVEQVANLFSAIYQIAVHLPARLPMDLLLFLLSSFRGGELQLATTSCCPPAGFSLYFAVGAVHEPPTLCSPPAGFSLFSYPELPALALSFLRSCTSLVFIFLVEQAANLFSAIYQIAVLSSCCSFFCRFFRGGELQLATSPCYPSAGFFRIRSFQLWFYLFSLLFLL
jgi:hypothetical protein